MKSKWAERQLAECRLCPRQCGVDRAGGETGWCGATADAQYFMEYVHYGEEPELVPSHTVYLTGCNLGCVFCHTAFERKDAANVRLLTSKELTAVIARGREEGAKNLNLLGGEPAVNLPALLGLFEEVTDVPPVVWNTNLYCTAETLSMTEGIADVYLADLKFGSDGCAKGAAKVNDYVDVVRSRLRELYQGGKKMIIRHLVLPGHVACCTRPSLEWIAKELPGARVSLKRDYLVMPGAKEHKDFGRFLSMEETSAVEELASSLDLDFVQSSLSSSPAPAGRKGTRTLDAEVVISPDGEVYLHHPTREIADLGAGISGDSAREEKE
ncbi:radical SAM protein [Planctomycetota bacterium]